MVLFLVLKEEGEEQREPVPGQLTPYHHASWCRIPYTQYIIAASAPSSVPEHVNIILNRNDNITLLIHVAIHDSIL